MDIAFVSEELLAVCDKEPIHIPESVQPHGALIALDGTSYDIVRVSANIEQFLNRTPAELLSLRFHDLYDSLAEADAAAAALLSLKSTIGCHRTEVKLGGIFDTLVCECHWIDEQTLIVEVEATEPKHQGDQQSDSNIGCFRAISDAQKQGLGLQFVLDRMAECIRAQTGYDRVMVYQLDEAGHGEVVSESRREDLPEFLGLHFPASDIPKQARILYLRNRVRLLSKINYQPIPVLSRSSVGNTKPLDMSLCHTRSVSPVHVEYLHNMGVDATLTISIVIDEQLWGMFACHHYSGKHIDANLRNQCEEFSHFASLSILAEQQREIRESLETSQSLLSELENRAGKGSNWLRLLLENGDFLLEQLDASGAVLFDESELYSVGTVPYSGLIEKIRRHMLSKSTEEIVYTESLPDEDVGFEHVGADFCGCLLTVVSEAPAIQILWFRKELRHTINWGGDPRTKIIHRDAAGVRLSPRKSFEKWCQEVQGNSLAWSLQDVYRAKAVSYYVSSRKVEDATRQKTQFLANMSHEIRTPMAAIVGYVDVLMENEESLRQYPIYEEALKTIRRNGDHLLQIINDILDLSKIEAGKFSVERLSCSPRNIIRDIESLLRPVADKKSISLEMFSKTPIPCAIQSDPTRLQQILLNMLGNAIKFTEKGCVTLEIVYDAARPEQIQFLVKDTGTVISPGDARKLFQPFIQADGSVTRKHGGTGLGLTISRQLARMLGGDLNIRESVIGVGTTFGLSIQTGISGEADVEDLSNEVQRPNASGPQKVDGPMPLLDYNILLAEDGIDNQRLLTLILRKAGAKVTMVENGQLAVDEVLRSETGEQPFDLILMDMQMPVLDGYEATRRLREAGYTLPIIALTAHAMTGDREKCLEFGCDDYFTKPVDRARLIDVIRQYVPSESEEEQNTFAINSLMGLNEIDLNKRNV